MVDYKSFFKWIESQVDTDNIIQEIRSSQSEIEAKRRFLDPIKDLIAKQTNIKKTELERQRTEDVKPFLRGLHKLVFEFDKIRAGTKADRAWHQEYIDKHVQYDGKTTTLEEQFRRIARLDQDRLKQINISRELSQEEKQLRKESRDLFPAILREIEETVSNPQLSNSQKASRLTKIRSNAVKERSLTTDIIKRVIKKEMEEKENLNIEIKPFERDLAEVIDIPLTDRLAAMQRDIDDTYLTDKEREAGKHIAIRLTPTHKLTGIIKKNTFENAGILPGEIDEAVDILATNLQPGAKPSPSKERQLRSIYAKARKKFNITPIPETIRGPTVQPMKMTEESMEGYVVPEFDDKEAFE